MRKYLSHQTWIPSSSSWPPELTLRTEIEEKSLTQYMRSNMVNKGSCDVWLHKLLLIFNWTCNCIAKFSYRHDMSSPCDVSVLWQNDWSHDHVVCIQKQYDPWTINKINMTRKFARESLWMARTRVEWLVLDFPALYLLKRRDRPYIIIDHW